MFTAGLHGRGQVEDLLGGDAVDGGHFDDAGPVGGQGAGLVQRDTAYRAQGLQGCSALDQGAELLAAPIAATTVTGTEIASAHGEAATSTTSARSIQVGGSPSRLPITAMSRPATRMAGTSGRAMRSASRWEVPLRDCSASTIRTMRASEFPGGRGDLDLQRSGAVDRPGEDLRPRARFRPGPTAGDRGGVQRGVAVADDAVGGDPPTGADQHAVADLQFGWRHVDPAPSRRTVARSAGDQGEQGAQSAAGTGQGVFLEALADGEQERQRAASPTSPRIVAPTAAMVISVPTLILPPGQPPQCGGEQRCGPAARAIPSRVSTIGRPAPAQLAIRAAARNTPESAANRNSADLPGPGLTIRLLCGIALAAATARPLTGVVPLQAHLCAAVDAVGRAQSHGLPACLQYRLGGGQQVDQGGLGQAEHRRPAHWLEVDQAALFEAGQVLGHRGLGQPDFLDELADPGLSGGQAAQDGQPGGITQRPEQRRRRGQPDFVTASDSTGIAIGRCYRHLVTFGPNGCMLERSGSSPGLPAKGFAMCGDGGMWHHGGWGGAAGS